MIYLLLFLEFLKIGLFTFGGGYAMIPLIRETVVARMWLTENEFYDFIGICESTPGPIAINMATYVGSTQAGFLGADISCHINGRLCYNWGNSSLLYNNYSYCEYLKTFY